MKRLLILIALLACSVRLLAADATIANAPGGAITTVPNTYVMPWENPAVQGYDITFLNLTNQILDGYAGQAYATAAAQAATNGYPWTNVSYIQAQGLTNGYPWTNVSYIQAQGITNGWPWTNLTVAHASAVTNGYPWTNLTSASAATINGMQALTNGNSFAATISNTLSFYSNVTVLGNSQRFILMTNGTAAAAGAPQLSPYIELGGFGYNTTSSSNTFIAFDIQNCTRSATAASANLTISNRIAGDAPREILRLSEAGSLTIGGNLKSISTFTIDGSGAAAVSIGGTVAITGDTRPSADATYSLGTAATRWLNVLASGNAILGGTATATNGYVQQVKGSFSTNFTCLTNLQFYCLNGTNQIVTLPNAANVPGLIFRFSMTNGYGSFIITNSTGTQFVRSTPYLSYTNIGIAEVSFLSDGANWWLASRGHVVMPSASWSLSTTITPIQDTITNIPFDTLEFNNSQGLGLVTDPAFARATRLYATNSGTYLITFSAVLKGSNPSTSISLWLRANGSDVARTRTDQAFTSSSAQQCMTVNFFQNVNAPTYFELCAASHDATCPTIVGAAANPTGFTAPAMPAIIVTINRVSDPWP